MTTSIAQTNKLKKGLICKPLMARTLKDNWKLWAVITGAISAIIVLLISVPSLMDQSKLGAVAGSSGASIVAQGMTMLYPLFIVMLASVYAVITANKLIAAQVDKGSMSYVLVNPIKRNQLTLSQGLFLAGSVVAMFASVVLIGAFMFAVTGDASSIGFFALLNLGCMLLILALSGITFLASCIFNRSGSSLAMGGGLAIGFTILSFLIKIEDLVPFFKIFRFMTINSLFNVDHISTYSTNLIWEFILMFVIAAVTYVAGAVIFKKKDLPL